jgi:hypothetical protein
LVPSDRAVLLAGLIEEQPEHHPPSIRRPTWAERGEESSTGFERDRPHRAIGMHDEESDPGKRDPWTSANRISVPSGDQLSAAL